MSTADYRTVFEIGLHSFPWIAMVIPVLFILIGFGLIRYSHGVQIRQLVGGSAIVMCSLILILLLISIVGDFTKERYAYARGKYSVVEGTVEDFHAMPYQGHAEESFTVRGVPFSFNGYDFTSCFHKAASHGGHIKPGLGVRVYYKDGCILRLDVRR
jgi:hypothetical protein